jgi:hypothetical protein
MSIYDIEELEVLEAPSFWGNVASFVIGAGVIAGATLIGIAIT